MSLEVVLVDGSGRSVQAHVTSAGQLVVGNLAFDETVSIELDTPDTAYSFYRPLGGQQFVIRYILAKADKEVDSSIPADVVVYEADSATATTVDKTLFQVPLIELEGGTLPGLNILVNEGKFLNVKTSDTSVFVTIMGYYIPKQTTSL